MNTYGCSGYPRLTNDDSIVSKACLQKSTRMLTPGKLQGSSGRKVLLRIVLMQVVCRSEHSKE